MPAEAGAARAHFRAVEPRAEALRAPDRLELGLRRVGCCAPASLTASRSCVRGIGCAAGVERLSERADVGLELVQALLDRIAGRSTVAGRGHGVDPVGEPVEPG